MRGSIRHPGRDLDGNCTDAAHQADGPARAPAVRHGAHNLEAYNLFLKGRFQWNKRTAEGLKKGLEYAELAIARGSVFRPGYVGVADSYILLAEYGLMSPESSVPPARSAARRALEIDPGLAEAHASLGLIRSIYDWDWVEAERHYQRAFDLNPGYATAHHWYSVDYLTLLGRFEEAFEEIDLAERLDPLSPIIREGKRFHPHGLEAFRRSASGVPADSGIRPVLL